MQQTRGCRKLRALESLMIFQNHGRVHDVASLERYVTRRANASLAAQKSYESSRTTMSMTCRPPGLVVMHSYMIFHRQPGGDCDWLDVYKAMSDLLRFL